MFLGEFHCTTDAQGSLALPKELRPALTGEITLTRGIERCLLIYPAQQWQQVAARIQERLHLTRSGDRAFARLVFSGALNCIPDAEGLIPLPENLRQYADIQEEAVIVGLYSHLELWNATRWAEIAARMESQAGVAVVNEDYPLI